MINKKIEDLKKEIVERKIDIKKELDESKLKISPNINALFKIDPNLVKCKAKLQAYEECKKEFEDKIKKLMKDPYAYLCNKCGVILECDIFYKGKCPECGSDEKIKLYVDFQIKKIMEELK